MGSIDVISGQTVGFTGGSSHSTIFNSSLHTAQPKSWCTWLVPLGMHGRGCGAKVLGNSTFNDLLVVWGGSAGGGHSWVLWWQCQAWHWFSSWWDLQWHTQAASLTEGDSRSTQLPVSGSCWWMTSQPLVEGMLVSFTSSSRHTSQSTISFHRTSSAVWGSSMPTPAPSRASPPSSLSPHQSTRELHIEKADGWLAKVVNTPTWLEVAMWPHRQPDTLKTPHDSLKCI